MAQSKRQTMVEVLTGTSIGFIGAWIITYLCIYYVKDPAMAATAGVVLCTVWSLVRGYMVRRHFAKQEG